MELSKKDGTFIAVVGTCRYATKGTVVLYYDGYGRYNLSFDTQNISFTKEEVSFVNGAEPNDDFFTHLLDVL